MVRRSSFVLLLVLGLIAGSLAVLHQRDTRLGLDLRGGVQLIYEAEPTAQQPTLTPEALQRALDIMRERVDALGVSEPELLRSGPNQIEVDLPGVENAERAAQQVGSTAQLFFYDWEANLLDPDCRTDPDANADQRQPITGFFQAVRQASRCDPQRDGDNSAADRPRFYAFDEVSQRALNNGRPSDTREAALEDLDVAELERARVVEVPEGILVVRDQKAARGRSRPRPLLGRAGRPGVVGHRHPQSGAGHRPAAPQRADRQLRVQRPRARRVPACHARHRPARTRQRVQGAGPAAFRDRARRRARLGALDRLRRVPGRDRRSDGRRDLGLVHDRLGAGPGGDLEDRGVAGAAGADLAFAGVGDARPAGARSGPGRGPRGLRARRRLPARLLPRARRDRRHRARRSTRCTCSR